MPFAHACKRAVAARTAKTTAKTNENSTSLTHPPPPSISSSRTLATSINALPPPTTFPRPTISSLQAPTIKNILQDQPQPYQTLSHIQYLNLHSPTMSTIQKDLGSVTSGTISRWVFVHGWPLNTAGSLRTHRQAAFYIDMGYRVTDHHGFDLRIDWAIDGTGGRIVRGEDPLCAYNDRERLKTLARAAAQGTDQTGRPANLPPRKITDYEKGVVHDIEDCLTPNCDHPAHFDGPKGGKLEFEMPDKKPDDLKHAKRDDKDGSGGAGAVGGRVSSGSKVEKA